MKYVISFFVAIVVFSAFCFGQVADTLDSMLVDSNREPYIIKTPLQWEDIDEWDVQIDWGRGYSRCEAMITKSGGQLIDEIRKYYTVQGVITEPGKYAYLYEDIPDEIPELCKVVQGLFLHVFWASAYGVELSDERKQEVQIRKVEDMLARIVVLDNRPITAPRDYDKRLVGNCRDFAVFLCSMLRHQGIPARARCGFATYFTPNRYEDHWICEYWHSKEERWIQVDAQLDSVQIRALKVEFDPHDVPQDKFLNAAKVWQACREGKIDPELCGIFDMKGLWFVQGDLVRDIMALNRLEVLPWDCNDLTGDPEKQVSADEYDLLDKAARLVGAGNQSFLEMRALFDSTPGFHMPSDWKP